MAGRWRLVLTKKTTGPHVVVNAFAFTCGACGLTYMTARELREHMTEARNAA